MSLCRRISCTVGLFPPFTVSKLALRPQIFLFWQGGVNFERKQLHPGWDYSRCSLCFEFVCKRKKKVPYNLIAEHATLSVLTWKHSQELIPECRGECPPSGLHECVSWRECSVQKSKCQTCLTWATKPIHLLVVHFKLINSFNLE